jgi:peptidoglycan/LPS O-acetylase OafA/YrhL
MKERFVVLDGLRGIAALAVVAYHAGLEMGLRGLFTIKATVAVDFFFCLSGFVLANSYDDKIKNGTLRIWNFVVMRWLRFLPILLLGGCLAYAALMEHPIAAQVVYDNHFLAFFLSLFLIPIPVGSALVWINGVYWSLCVELVVNAFYSALGTRADNRTILTIWIFSTACLILITLWMLPEELLPNSYGGSFGSLARGFTSFFAGIAIYRLWRADFRFGKLRPVVLVVIFSVPLIFPYSAAWFRMPFDLFFIIVVFPMIVLAGASSVTKFGRTFGAMGEASFPLYGIHLPLLYLTERPFVNFGTIGKMCFVLIFTASASLIAFVVARVYEAPARAFIKQILLGRFNSAS